MAVTHITLGGQPGATRYASQARGYLDQFGNSVRGLAGLLAVFGTMTDDAQKPTDFTQLGLELGISAEYAGQVYAILAAASPLLSDARVQALLTVLG